MTRPIVKLLFIMLAVAAVPFVLYVLTSTGPCHPVDCRCPDAPLAPRRENPQESVANNNVIDNLLHIDAKNVVGEAKRAKSCPKFPDDSRGVFVPVDEPLRNPIEPGSLHFVFI